MAMGSPADRRPRLIYAEGGAIIMFGKVGGGGGLRGGRMPKMLMLRRKSWKSRGSQYLDLLIQYNLLNL